MTLPVDLRAWQISAFASTWVAYAGFYLCRKNFAVAMPLLETDLGFSKTELAYIVTAFSVSYALGQVFGGPLADRGNTRRVVGLALAAAAGANVLMGLSASFWAFAALGFMNGVAQSVGWPGLTKIMANWFPSENRGAVMGWWSTNYVTGGLVATVLASYVVSHPTLLIEWPWQRVFWAPAAILVVIAAGFMLTAKNDRPEIGLPSIVPPGDGEPVGMHSGVVQLSRPVMRATAAIGALLKYVRYSIIYWLPLFLVDRMRYSVGKAGYVSAVFEVAGFAGSIFAGYASDRWAGSRRFPVVAVMQVGLAVACVSYPLISEAGLVTNVAGISLIGFMLYGPDTLLQGALAQDLGLKSGVAASAGLISGTSAVGQVISPILVAWLSDAFGWDSVFYSFAVAAALGALLTRPYSRK